MATKRYVALLIIMLMVGTKAFAYDIGARNADGVTIYYNYINDGTELEVTRSPTGSYYRGELIIPEEVTLLGITRKVTSIGGAFWNCQNLTSVTIPNTVTIIHRESFANSGLTSITIPNSVTSVEWFAFAYCYNLSSVTIGNNVKSIGKGAFYDCLNLTSVTIGNSVASIEEGAFSGCSRLSNVIIPNSVTSIGDVAFADCGLTSITIPNSVTRIGGQAFYGCNMMKKVITKIEKPFAISGDTFDKYAYNNGELYVPAGTMGKYKNKEGWRNFNNIKESTSEIQKQRTIHVAKAGTLPDLISEEEKYQVEELTLTGELNGTDFRLLRDMAGNNYLGERTNGRLVKLDISNAQIVSGGLKYIETQLIRFDDETVTILNHNISVTPNEIPNMAFCGCTLKSIILPNSVEAIGESAFNHCWNLISVTIPNSVTNIGDNAFSGCSGLTSVTFGNNVTNIGDNAFKKCSGLTSITIPNSVTSIGFGVFSKCSGLSSITIPNSVTSIGDMAFNGCSSLTSITIGSSVTSIGLYAFQNCENLPSITIPNSVKSIGGGAFYGCNIEKVISKIENPFEISSGTFDDYTYNNGELYVPTGTIDKYKVTEGWRNFKNIIQIQRTIHLAKAGTLPDLISEAEKYKIEELTLTGELNGTDFRLLRDMAGNNYLGERTNGRLVKLDISNAQIVSGGLKYLETEYIKIGRRKYDINDISINPNEIPNGVFCGCTLESIILPNSVEAVGESAFCHCSSLTSITIPNSVTSIGSSAFYECSGLTSVTIGNSVTSIGLCAFQNCESLTSIFIPNSVTSIGDGAFHGCNMKEVFSKVENPFSISSTTFNENTFNNGKLYVPIGTVEMYKTTKGWNRFKYIVEGSPSNIRDIEREEAKEIKRYAISGNIIAVPQKGINIIKMKNGTTKKVVVK